MAPIVRHTLAELASKHGVYQTMIAQWKRQAIEGMAGIFSGKQTPEAAGSPADVEMLHVKIGQLPVERAQGGGGRRSNTGSLRSD